MKVTRMTRMKVRKRMIKVTKSFPQVSKTKSENLKKDKTNICL